MEKYKNVFSPFRFGKLTIKNRIQTPPMLSCLASPEGYITREMIAFYQAFARGGAGIVNIGDSSVDFEYGHAHFGQLNLGDDRVIGGLSTMAEQIQKYGARISAELDHSGRLASSKVIGKDPIGPSPIPSKAEEMAAMMEGRPAGRVKEMDQDMIDRVVDHFASAAERCLKAGFEMVTIHGGHGQLLSQFVSPYSNKRTDHYGGSLAKRARFVLEVLAAIRRRVGDRLALEYRVSADEFEPEGMHEEETIEFLKIIEGYIDLVNVSLGGMMGDPRYIKYMAQPTYLPHAFNALRAENIKKALNIPVTCVGSVIDLEMADRIIAEGKADIVAMGRAHIADPEIVNKTLRGETDDVRPCLRCNVCGERPADFYPVRCAVNPLIGRELEYRYIPPPTRKKKIVIVGGGPAGMQAAISASSRGHDVVLFEKEKELGGALRMAASPSFKGDMKRFLDWMVRKTSNSSAQIRLATEAALDSIVEEAPDILILAVGAEPIIPDIPGIKGPNVCWAGDVDTGKAETGNTVIVAGAGLTGCETALHLAMQSKNVTVVDMIPETEIAGDTGFAGRIALIDLLRENAVEFKTEVKLEEISEKGAIIIDKNWNRFEIEADTVVLSMGVQPLDKTVDRLKDAAREVHVIGDCAKSRNIMAAIHDGFNVTAEI